MYRSFLRLSGLKFLGASSKGIACIYPGLGSLTAWCLAFFHLHSLTLSMYPTVFAQIVSGVLFSLQCQRPLFSASLFFLFRIDGIRLMSRRRVVWNIPDSMSDKALKISRNIGYYKASPSYILGKSPDMHLTNGLKVLVSLEVCIHAITQYAAR